MGITPLHAHLIIREHQRRSLPQTVHLLGRQTVSLTLDQASNLIRSVGIQPMLAQIEIDKETRGALASQNSYISDRTFFALLGVSEVLAIDHSDYEGADIILDLNKLLPDMHRETVEFLYGGSVLDNIFDPATYLRNVAESLKPGGRLFEQDIISQHHHPYCLISPAWMLDYFVVNEYDSCQIYICEHSPSGFIHIYGLNGESEDVVSDFGPPRGNLPIGIVAIAEKGRTSTSNLMPIQDQYRDGEDRDRYRGRLSVINRGHDFFDFPAPTPLELCRLGKRTSKSYSYLGVVRGLGVGPPEETDLHSLAIGGLRIFEATYGGNCAGAALGKSGVSSIYRGNVTEVLAGLFNGVDSQQWLIDVNVLGDPAPEHPKDLEVFYCNMRESVPLLRRAYVAAEASGRILHLPEKV